jgi:hypothetical protein
MSMKNFDHQDQDSELNMILLVVLTLFLWWFFFQLNPVSHKDVIHDHSRNALWSMISKVVNLTIKNCDLRKIQYGEIYRKEYIMMNAVKRIWINQHKSSWSTFFFTNLWRITRRRYKLCMLYQCWKELNFWQYFFSNPWWLSS